MTNFILDVTEADFEYEVISFSQNTPVVVDFWATWCKPCTTLSPILEKLAHEGNGNFRLAKVDVDANPNLALRFSVRSIPTVKAFVQGRIVAEFSGLQPESRIREFIDQVTPPDEASLALEKAQSLLDMHHWIEAEDMFRALLKEQPDHPGALLGLAKSLLGQGKSGESLHLVRTFPPTREYARAEILRPLAEMMVNFERGNLPQETDLDAAFISCIRLSTRGNLPAALDGLLDILRQNKRYRGDLARKVFLGILEVLGDEDPQTRQYRSELASVLF